LVAVCPTACDLCNDKCTICDDNNMVILHYISAVSLFSILAYFCLGPFRQKKDNSTKERQCRVFVYLVCGCTMVASMLIAGMLSLVMTKAALAHYRVTFWAEAFALGSFGIAWMVAGKNLPLLRDSGDQTPVPVVEKIAT